MTHVNWFVTKQEGWIKDYHTYSTEFGGLCVRVEEGGSEYRWVVAIDGDVIQKGTDLSLDNAQTKAIAAAKMQSRVERPVVLVRSMDLRDRVGRRVNATRRQTLADIGERSDDDADYFDQPH